MSEQPKLSPLEKTVVIVGVGLIGGSLAAALKHRNVAETVIGVGRDPVRIQAACTAGLIDEATTEIVNVIGRADLVVFCTPVDRVAKDVKLAISALNDLIKQGRVAELNSKLLFTDVGSVKALMCAELAGVPQFVGSHPIAGSHQQGFEAANAGLFEGRVCVLTPNAISTPDQITRLERFWRSVGMRTIIMSPLEHDESLAMTSHLPHLTAAALAATLSEENRGLTGSGFRDTTRVAAGDPELWTGILINNAASLLKGIDVFQQKIDRWRAALETVDAAEIRNLLAEGKASRVALDKTVCEFNEIDTNGQ